MKSFLRVTGKEMSYGIRSVRFWGTAVALAVLMLLDAAEQIGLAKTVDDAGAVIYKTDILTLTLDIISGSGYLFWVRFCLFAVPFGCCFFDEYSHCASKYRLTRSNRKIYGISKMAAGTILTGAVVILANLMMLIVLKGLGFPFLREKVMVEVEEELYYDSGSMVYYTYGLVDAGHPVLMYLLALFFAALSAVFFSAMTIMLSAFIRNRYILIAMPLVLFYSIDSLLVLFFYPEYSPPVWLDLRRMFFSLMYDGAQTELAGILRTLLYTLAGVAVFSALFIHRIREVSENE